jgi:hypothetical protein
VNPGSELGRQHRRDVVVAGLPSLKSMTSGRLLPSHFLVETVRYQRTNHQLFAEFVAGGEGERIDARKRPVRRSFNRSLKCIGDSSIARLPQEFPERLRFSHCACSATASATSGRT